MTTSPQKFVLLFLFLYYFVRLVRVVHLNGDNGMSSCAEVVATNSCWQTGSTTVRPSPSSNVYRQTNTQKQITKPHKRNGKLIVSVVQLHVTSDNRQQQQHTETTPLSHIERLNILGVHRRHNKHRPIHTAQRQRLATRERETRRRHAKELINCCGAFRFRVANTIFHKPNMNFSKINGIALILHCVFISFRNSSPHAV